MHKNLLYKYNLPLLSFFAFSILNILPCIIQAQKKSPLLQQLEQNIDSLAKVNPKLVLNLSNRLKLEALSTNNKLVEAKSYRYQSKALYFLNRMEEAAYANLACAQALVNAQDSNLNLTAECFLYSSMRYWDLGIFDLTKDLAIKGIDYARKSKNDLQLVRGYDIVGQVHFRQGNYEQALVYYDSCYQVDVRIKDTLNQVADLGIIGRINTKLGRPEGISILKEAIQLLGAHKQSSQYSMAINALGLGYANLKDYKNANQFIQEALSIAQELRDTHLIINRYINLGFLHTDYGFHESAEQYLLKSLELMKEEFEPNRITIIYQNLGKVYQEKRQFTKASTYYDQALAVAEKGKMLPIIKDVYQGLSGLHEVNQDYQKALFYHQQYKEISDSIYTINAQIQTTALNFKYESVSKEASIQRLESDNSIKEEQLLRLRQQRQWIVGLFCLLALVGSLFFRLFRIKKQKQLLLQQQKINLLQRDIAQAIQQSPPPMTPLTMESINQLLTNPLTEREFEILNLIASGKSNKEVAEHIFLSINTVKFHLKNIYSKLEVKNRVQAIQIITRRVR